jgi:hypothetical protein
MDVFYHKPVKNARYVTICLHSSIFIVRALAKRKEKWYYFMLKDYIEEQPYEYQNHCHFSRASE